MKNMKNRKAPGRDEITIEQLKALNEEGLKILTNICNEVYSTGHIPEDLRHSIFVKIPLFTIYLVIKYNLEILRDVIFKMVEGQRGE